MNLLVSAPSGSDDAALAAGLGAMAHPVRLDILRQLAARDACCCGEIVSRTRRAQSTVSQHLKVLVEAGLVRYEPDNRRSRYSIDREAVARLSAALGVLASSCCPLR